MPPKKKTKTDDGDIRKQIYERKELFDFVITLGIIARLYKASGDTRRAGSFETVATNLRIYRDVSETLKSSDDYKSVEGVGKSTLSLIDEFIATGTCSRLDELIPEARKRWRTSFNWPWKEGTHPDDMLLVLIDPDGDYVLDPVTDRLVSGLVIYDDNAWVFTLIEDRVRWHVNPEDGLPKDQFPWFHDNIDAFINEVKKATGSKRTLRDFVLILGCLANKYETLGDVGRAKSFNTSAKKLESFASLNNELTDSTEYENLKGVGKSTLELMDEFIKTGTCARLDELGEKDNQVPLIEDGPSEADLELGVFRDEEDEQNFLFLYHPADKYPLYKNIHYYFEDTIRERQEDWYHDWDGMGGIGDVEEEMIESYAGLQCLTEEYRDYQKHFFVRKATAKDRKQKDWAGDADPNWQKPKMSGITREELRELVRNGHYEEKYENAYEQLIKEEKAFLEKAKTDLRSALEDFPYKEVAYDDGFDLLVEDTILDLDGYKMYCKECKEPKRDEYYSENPRSCNTFYELYLLGKKCYLALGKYGYHPCWTDENQRAFYYTKFDDPDADGDVLWVSTFLWDDEETEEYDDFCKAVSECLGIDKGELDSNALMDTIDSLYDKHNLRRSEYRD